MVGLYSSLCCIVFGPPVQAIVAFIDAMYHGIPQNFIPMLHRAAGSFRITMNHIVLDVIEHTFLHDYPYS